MKLKAVLILALIIISLIPAYLFYQWLEKKMIPRSSGKNFLIWLLLVFAFIFIYTFLVVFLIRSIFPKA